MAGLPTGTVTFLFTDIEGSTRLWQEQPDAMKPALARHDEILRDAIAAHAGHYVKTTGDGAHAVFTTASDAIDAAVDAQRAIGAESWSLPNPLRVRMGIHSGPAELRDGDYFGTTVNRAARIMSVAHGGQVVISHATQELARDDGREVFDLGEHRLKDLGQPEHIFQVMETDLERDFPRLRSLDAFTTNLPTQRTSFVGRDAEVAAVKEALADGRLVTLTGVGGVGKTRLAVQVAAEMVTEFPEGVWLVELAAVGDPVAVPDVIATTVGLVQTAGLTMTASIADALAGRRSLLVLDNCEHVLDAAAEVVEAILARPGSVKVLATSREGLRLDDERLHPVPSLGGRQGGGAEAIELFADRARAATPEFDLGAPGVADAVEEICRRLDGIPLAIELAAARTIAMSAPELRDRLDDRFRLLSGSRRGLERHQTLRQAVQWSYDLLDHSERALLNRCAVFAGGFALPAAVAIGGSEHIDEYAVLNLLEALVRKSLLTVDRGTAATRYSMLETIRQFAEEQLAATDDIAEIRAHHARYYAQQAAETLTWLGGPREVDALARMRLELANLRVAFRTAADGENVDSAAAIAVPATALCYYVDIFEPASWAEELLDAARARDHPQLANLYSVACVCSTSGRVDDAVRYADEACTLLADPKYELIPCGISCSAVGLGYLHVGRPDAWADYIDMTIERDANAGDFARGTKALALMFSGHHDEAAALAADFLERVETTPSPLAATALLSAYGTVFLASDPARALVALRKYEAIGEEHGWTSGHTGSLVARGEAACGNRAAALDACERALRSYAASGDRPAAGTPLNVLASILHDIGQDEAAAIVAGCGATVAMAGFPELAAAVEDLRETLGADAFDSLAARGPAMETNAMFRYALEQVDVAREVITSDA